MYLSVDLSHIKMCGGLIRTIEVLTSLYGVYLLHKASLQSGNRGHVWLVSPES
jgi:hypothetical protein